MSSLSPAAKRASSHLSPHIDGKRPSGIRWGYFAAIPLLFVLYFYGLTRVGLIGPDEPRYASIGRAMATTGDWVTPRLWGDVWLEKPALLYWLIGSAYKVGVPEDLAPRLPVALLSVAFVIFFYYRMRREFGGAAAFYASAILASSAGWLAYSQVAVTDLPLAASFGGAILLCLPWIRSGGRRGLLIAGVLLGIAVLSKGLVPLVLVLPVVVIGHRRWPDLFMFAGACLCIALPWYVLCWWQNGDIFIQEFIYKHHIERFVSPSLQHVQPSWFYVPVLLGFLYPWTPAVALLFGRRVYQDRRRLLLAAVVVFGFVFFSASTNKLPGYILPLMPLVAALIGVRLSELGSAKWILGSAALLLCILPVIGGVLPAALASGLSRAPIASFLSPWMLPVFGIAALCWWFETRAKRRAAVLLLVIGITAGVAVFKLSVYPAIDSRATARPLWRGMLASKSFLCVTSGTSRSLRYGLNFYAGYALPDCTSSEAGDRRWIKDGGINYNNVHRN